MRQGRTQPEDFSLGGVRLQRYARRLAALTWLAMALIAIAGFAAFDLQEVDHSKAIGSRPASQQSSPDEPASTGANTLRSPIIQTPLPTSPSTTPTPPPTTTSSTPTTTTTTTTTLTPLRDPPPEAEQWRSLIEEYFPSAEVGQALAVLWCESRGIAKATNPSSGAAGLFQHLPKYWPERSVAAGFTGSDIYNPQANAGVAAWLATTQGWYHWNASKHCWG